MAPIDRRSPLWTDQRRFECQSCGRTDTAPFHLSACPQCGGTVRSTLTDEAARSPR